VELTPSELELPEHFVRNLRAEIDAEPHNPESVRTVRDVGYRFEG